ncbi:HVO_0234 family beta-propeller protein [Natronorubrum daqingense]|uniref:HVO-0234-like beta-propeller domain-containing protein n=1 Tax=Natronorubrum daqingense TaxID=588898 RepID=A0A1N7EVA0_9EURY|nr:hypothetical protein [Natronorubrum daqingense]APX97694.1 hypothetical protein BB347_14325 [Natronorubrum daqingense]SIR92003.1 hypothetical protein SAMN05421809_2888 [Natronorubrum daqingense]
MDSIEEKRVYGDREGAIEGYVASSIGVVRVRVAGDTVGEFGLCDRCDARDVAATDDIVAIATGDDVRVLHLERGADEREQSTDDAEGSDETFVATGFGPAVAVGFHDEELIAASPDGDLATLSLEAVDDSLDTASLTWNTIDRGDLGDVRAIDGGLIGTENGVYRLHDGHLDHAGLAAVRDVSAAGVPLAATADGLYKLGNGWMEVLEGEFDAVAADPRTEPGQLTRAHAVSGGTVYAYGGVDVHDGNDGDDASDENDSWHAYDRSSEPVVGLGYGETVYAVTKRGTFLAGTPESETDRWRSQTLGVGDVTGLAILSTSG